MKVRLEAVVSAFQAQMAQAGVSAKGLATEIDGISGKSEQSFKKLGMGLLDTSAGTATVAAGAAVAGAALLKLGKDGVDAFTGLGTEVASYKRIAGGTAEDASRMVAALHAVGITSEEGATAVFRLSQNLAKNSDALKAAGVVVAYDRQGNVDLNKTLLNLSDAYRNIENPQQRNVLMMQALGRGAVALAPLLARTRGEIQEFWKEAERHGLVLSQADLDNVREYKLAVHELGDAWKGVEVNIGKAVVPELTQLIDQVERAISDGEKLVARLESAAASARSGKDSPVVRALEPSLPGVSLGLNLPFDMNEAKKGALEAIPVIGGLLAGLGESHKHAADAASLHARAETQAQLAVMAVSLATGVAVPRVQALAEELHLDLTTGADKARTALQDAAAKLAAAVTPTERLADVTSVLTDTYATGSEKVKAFDAAIDAMLGSQLNADSATLAMRQSMQSLADAIATGVDKGETFAEFQDRLSGGLVTVVRNIDAARKAMVANGEITADAASQQAFMVTELQAVAAQFPELRTQINDYITRLGAIPGDITTTVTLNVDQALEALNKMLAATAAGQALAASPAGGALAGAVADEAAATVTAAVNAAKRAAGSALGAAPVGHNTHADAASKAEAKQQDEINGYLKAVYQQRMQIIENQYHAGKVSRDEYLKSLDDQMAHEVPWTDAWVALQQKKTDALAEWDDALKGIQAMQQAFQDNEHEAGVIGNADYLKILQARLAGLKSFSNDWMAVWRQIQQIESAETSRLDDARDKALGSLNSMLDQEQSLRGQLQSLVSQHEAKMLQIEQQYTADMGKVLADRRDQLLGWADVTQKVTVKWGVSAAALTRNIRSQVSSFDDWVNALDAARAKGVSDQVVSLLGLDEGPQALGQLKMFASATTQQIDDLNKSVAERAQKVDAEVGREQTQSYSKIAAQLQTLAEQHAAAIEQETEDFLKQQKDLNTQLAQIGMDSGRSYGQALADGLTSSIPAIQAAARAAQDALTAATNQEQQAGQAATAGPTPEFLAFFATQPADVQNYLLALGQMPAHASGIDYVPATGPALIHQGERIFSAMDNRQMIAAIQSIGSGGDEVHLHVDLNGREIQHFIADLRSRALTRAAIAGAR